MVYDQWDRPVLTQSANLRTSNKWMFTKYDWLNRPIMTGFYVNNTYTTQSAMQGFLNTQNLGRYESDNFVTFPYTLSQSFPVATGSDVLTITYYDDYRWTGWYGLGSKDNSFDSYFQAASNSTYPYPQPLTQSSKTLGLVTGSWGNNGMVTGNFYDDNGRIIQTKGTNQTGGWDITTTQYNWAGQPNYVVWL